MSFQSEVAYISYHYWAGLQWEEYLQFLVKVSERSKREVGVLPTALGLLMTAEWRAVSANMITGPLAG